MLSDKNIEEQDIIQFVSNFQNDGFATMEHVFATRLIDGAKGEAERNFSECTQIIENRKLPFGIGTKLGFKEIVQRHKSRFEMPYKMDSPIFDFVLEHPSIKKILELLFELNDYRIINRSCVISLPEASCQSWHSDGPHISVLEYLPCHCLNLFIPLVDVDRTNGPTEFRPGSHKYTNNLAKSMLLAKARGTLRPVVVPELSVGSILMVSHHKCSSHLVISSATV
jgi:hypothetical protein